MRALSVAWAIILAGVSPAAEPPLPDEIDLVFLAPERPYFMRLHVQFGGRSYQDHWHGVIEQLFRHLDSNGDGILNRKELEAAPSAEQFRLLVEGVQEIEAGPPPEPADLADESARDFTPAQVRTYYQRAGVGPWQIRWAVRTSSPTRIDDVLVRHLNCASPDNLARTELMDCREKLLKRDLDHDELITLFELDETQGLPAFAVRGELPKRDLPIVNLERSPKGRQLLAQRLLTMYDKNKDGKLDSKELGIPVPLLAQLDPKRVGSLQRAELERWPDLAADLELVVRMDVPSASANVISLARPTSQAAATRIGSVRWQLPQSELEVIRVDGSTAPPGRQPPPLLGFQALDRNRDGVLSHAEIFQPPFRFVPYLRLADRNHDDQLSRKEIEDYVDLQKRLTTRLTTVTLVERQQALWDLLDSDHDARLSIRELRTAWERLKPWAAADTVARRSIPHQYQVLLSHGVLIAADGDPGKGRALRGVERQRGPTWFRKMDRNADGDISRAEFLGSAEQFRTLDRDGDGLIDANEASVLPLPKK